MQKNEREKEIMQNSKQILPFQTVCAVLGSFFTVVSIIYIVIVSFCKDSNLKLILLILEGILSFLCMFFVFFYIAIKNNRKCACEIYDKCGACIKDKVNNSLRLAGLYEISEILEIEEKLSKDSNPEKCEVLIYTSNLATEEIAQPTVKKNLDKKVKYRIIYFSNTYSADNTQAVKKFYGEDNIIDLNMNPIYNDTVDSNLSKALGFDIMIYKTSNDVCRGFFAVDFVLFEEGVCSFRPKHSPTCECKCDKEDKKIYYKEISSDLTKKLCEDFNKIFKEKANGKR